MVGLNSLSKLFRKTIGPRIEALGLLPHRYYLNRALDALEQDDIDEAVRMITLAGNDKKDSRWRLICQQVIFRCRVLASLHEKNMERLKKEIEIFGKSPGIRETYRRLHETEAKALEILSNYESSLLKQLTGSNGNTVRA